MIDEVNFAIVVHAKLPSLWQRYFTISLGHYDVSATWKSKFEFLQQKQEEEQRQKQQQQNPNTAVAAENGPINKTGREHIHKDIHWSTHENSWQVHD